MDMESIPLDLSFLDEEPQKSSSVQGDQMDYGTFGNLSDASLPNEICKGSDLFLFNPTSLNTTTNWEGISSINPLFESSACQDSGFSFDRKLYSSPSYADNFYSLALDKYLSEEQEFPSLLNCGNLMKSPLSSEDIESILDTTSLSDDGDTSLSPLGTPPSSPELQEALICEDIPVSSSPSSSIHLIHTNESDGVQVSGAILDVSLDHLIHTNESDGVQVSCSILDASLGHAITGETSRSSSPCLLVSSPGKEKRTKSYRTKKTPYFWDKSTESIPSPIDVLDQHLSKKDKKKLQNKNAATRYRHKMKEEVEQRKQEEDELLKENRRLKKRVEEIQKEIQYLKNLQDEIGKVRTKL